MEDEVLIRLHLAEELRDAGYTVCEAADAHEAMTLLSSLDRVRLMLTDIRMPGGLDGMDLARWVRAKFPEIKIVLISAEYIPETSAGFDAGFTKPVRIDDLLRCVRRLLPQAELGN
ncbi:response regulator [Hyphomicrobium sp.]|uniref:response regulator n=1 Tax=Hyphomicrobium sp. TaxID=82 RepID=UPI002D78B711|nr:response regulator [Hyphomicrobium sp.]HET6390404.1 response regulator [Hyphomicrobium sp.]